jgi:hypothetical protein
MANRTPLLAALAIAIAGGFIGYQVAFAESGENNLNYEVQFDKPKGWIELPQSPSTLLLARDPKTRDLIRCSYAQVVDDANPDPQMNTKRFASQVVTNAKSNQPGWQTDRIGEYDNGTIAFELVQKAHQGKTIIIALAVRGNTTFITSVSNSGKRGAEIAKGDYDKFRTFLNSIRFVPSDKWRLLQQKYDSLGL